MATPVYTDWPTVNDISEKLASASIDVPTTVNPATYFTRIQVAVAAEITKRTHRQFIAATATRYFDGSGTGVQEVDEIVTLTSVGLMGFVGSPTPQTLANTYLRTDNTYPNTMIEIGQGSAFGGTFLYLDRFPQGRQNIQVVGSWGYAATIPADLWESACEEMAARLAAEFIFDPDGRVQEWQAGDSRTKWLLQLPGDAATWHTRYTGKICEYTRLSSRNIRRLRPPMI